MAQPEKSIKRSAITKANSQTMIVVAVAAFVSIFSLTASQALWSQSLYLNKVIKLKQQAHAQLKDNLEATAKLSDAYQEFVSRNPNALKGSVTGTGDKDGDNAKLVLNALPSSYDFPALTSSVEKILNSRNLKIEGITGTDDEIAQKSASAATPNPQPVPIAFSFQVGNANYTAIRDLIESLQHSIRPIQVDTLNLTGDSQTMELTITAHTYYQPPKSVNISEKAVK